MVATDDPRVSVVMSVFNSERYVRRAIGSILAQSYKDFEFVIIDDGSTDRSRHIIESFDDPRIRHFYQSNRGIAAALNRGIRMSRCEYIARMDADDLAYATRIEKQVEFLDQHPACALLGSAVQVVDPFDRPMWVMRHPTEDLDLRWHLLFDTPFVHSSVMFRREAANAVGMYDEKHASQAEDYQLWSRLLAEYQAANLEELLLDYRDNPLGFSHSKRTAQEADSQLVSSHNIASLLGEPFTVERARALRGLRTVIWPPPNLDAVCQASRDLERLGIAFQAKYAPAWAGKSKSRRLIQHDKARAQLVAAFFAGYHGSRTNALRLILQALGSSPWDIASIPFYRALIILGLGFAPYARLRNLVGRRSNPRPDSENHLS